MNDLPSFTELWHRAHSHLQPFTTHLPLREDERCQCPLCHASYAFRLTAQVRYGADEWRCEHPVYCPDCKGYSLPFPSRAEPITAIDARLWSREPTFLNIEPTTRCNFNCWYCVGRHMVQGELSYDDFVQVLDNFPSVKTIALVGEGEPLMHKAFFAMADLARERGIRIMIISNGSTLSSRIVKKLCESEVAYVSVSIDSTDANVFARSRIDGKLDKIWQGIQRLRQYRDEHGYLYPKIGVKGTLFSYSKNELLDIVRLAKSYGVEIFESFQTLNPMITYTPIYPEHAPDELAHIHEVAAEIERDSEIARDLLLPVTEFCEQEGIKFDKNGTPNGVRNNCDEQWIYSLLNGDVTPCCQIKQPISDRWNLTRHSIDSILSDQLYENTRFNLWNGLFPKYCEGCWKTR